MILSTFVNLKFWTPWTAAKFGLWSWGVDHFAPPVSTFCFMCLFCSKYVSAVFYKCSYSFWDVIQTLNWLSSIPLLVLSSPQIYFTFSLRFYRIVKRSVYLWKLLCGITILFLSLKLLLNIGSSPRKNVGSFAWNRFPVGLNSCWTLGRTILFFSLASFSCGYAIECRSLVGCIKSPFHAIACDQLLFAFA